MRSPVLFPLSVQIELSGVTLGPERLNSALTANLISDLKLLTLHSYPRNFVQLLEEAKDQCVFYSYDREYYKCFYLEAIKARRDSRVSQSIDLYQLAMESILTSCQDARIFTKYTVQLLDILVQLRNAGGKEQLKHYRKVLKRFSPSEEICSILEGSDAAFSAYYENYIPQTPLRDVREKLGYPAV